MPANPSGGRNTKISKLQRTAKEFTVRLKSYVDHPKQAEFVTSPAKRKIIRAGRRSGKAQPLDAKIYTPCGPIEMGDVKIGQEVCTPDGIATVEAIYPQGEMDIFEVHFGDGTWAEASGNHWWEVCEARTDSQWKNRHRLITTQDIALMPTVIQEGRGTNRRPTIPPTSPVAFRERTVPLDPYLLGALIGDGAFSKEGVRFSCAESWLLEKVKALCPRGITLRYIPDSYDYQLTTGVGGVRNQILHRLKYLGLEGKKSHEKFIPDVYKYNSVNVRMEIIRGLLDTDGSVDACGQPKFEQTSQRLAADFQEVIESLGGLVTNREKMGGYRLPDGTRRETRKVYRQTVLYDHAEELFTLPAKKEKARPRARAVRRFIRNVEFSRKAEAQCIKISDPRGLYLTDHFIATHNTTGMAILAVEQFLKGHRILYAAPTTDQLKKFWSEVAKALAEPIEYGIYKKNESEHFIELRGTQQRIRAKTAWNADSMRGDTCDLLILDEWQLMDESAWEDVGAPMLIDNNGDAAFIYTPPSLKSRSASKARDIRHAAKMFKRAEEDKSGRWLALHFTSHDNPHISEAGLEEITKDMTKLSYDQEIMALDIDKVPGALWDQATIDAGRVEVCPELVRIVVGIDPTGSTTTEAGIVAAGQDARGHGYVIEDASILGAKPNQWAGAAVRLYYDRKADRICGERNYGGDMVEATIRTVDDRVSYKDVNATRGKMVRAEPIAAMYEGPSEKQPKKEILIHHVGQFPQLEGEMTSYVPGNPSPNRMDAMVWTLTELMIGQGALGLIEYYKEGHAANDLKKLENSMQKVQSATDLAKPVIADEAPKCPECGSALVRDIPGGMRRCSQCGIQFFPKDAKGNLIKPKVNLGARRGT